MRRPINYDPNLARKLAKSVVREDPTRAVVELVTNSDDSFVRLGKSDHVGRITIGIKRGHDTAYLIVSDNAEGMNKDVMDQAVGGYGWDTSGFRQGKKVRGIFGRGLKEAILGLGSGVVESIQDSYYYRCTLDADGNYEFLEQREAKP